MFDMHRHDEFSTFDGFGKALELANLAKDLGHSALSLTNHGNTNGLVKHYEACKKAEINCIMGVEAYFQPTFNKEKKRYHLCLLAKNLKGYENINKLMYIGEHQKYYNPIITFENLEQYKEGIICTTACIAGFVPACINTGQDGLAEKALQRFKKIFGDDFYIEIQPYKIDATRTQEKVNVKLIELARKLKIKCILTSDSHYGAKEDFGTYLKMHEIAKHTSYDLKQTYGERYMPRKDDMAKRFIHMHKGDFAARVTEMATKMYANLDEIEAKVEQNILDQLDLKLPEFVEGRDSYDILLEDVKRGLKELGHSKDKAYVDRCKEELKIIKMHGYADYFLIVADYVKWAKDNDIKVGPGRGSVCNCEIAYILGITTVDSLRFDLVFQRFLREDKAKLPDIDLDFETSRRQEVIDYLVNKYRGHSAQVCSYGLYRIDNCANDLSKVCGDLDDDKEELKRFKKHMRDSVDSTQHLNYNPNDPTTKYFNKNYDNIAEHFSRLYNKVRFIGTHAAGVAITGNDISKYCGIKCSDGKEFSVYDLADLETVNVVKFDMLGLKTMESIGELRQLTGCNGLTDEIYEDALIWKNFAAGDTNGVFQFESPTSKSILQNMNCDCFEDMVAASSMNRPGPLMMKMPDQYAYNKFHQEEVKKYKYYKYTKATYGTIVYQEQLQQIATQCGKLSWADADKLMKLMKSDVATMGDLDERDRQRKDMTERFVKGAVENGWSKSEAKETFKGMLNYVFNKGHAVAYAMISLEEMFFKTYYPNEFWYTKIKYAGDDSDIFKYNINAVKDGGVLFLPHVNYNSDYSLRKVDGDTVIQMGLVAIKGVGSKASEFIQNERIVNGRYKSLDDFLERCKVKGSAVNKGTVEKLIEEGALEFDKKVYYKRVVKFNSTLYSKGLR